MRINNFIKFFKTTPLWANMVATVEDSPWHREANTAVHTEMCMDQYVTRFAAERTEQEYTIAMLALLFHDTGKPDAEQVLEKLDGSGTYRRYAGHEPLSATIFAECYMTMPELHEMITSLEARAVRWCIEHHLPYGLKDAGKRLGLRSATHLVFESLSMSDRTFFDVLRSDSAGRISDDHDVKLAAVEGWITEFKAIEPVYNPIQSPNTMYILVGASGSGKSTWIRKQREQLNGTTVTISQDEQKIKYFQQMFPDRKFESEAALYDAAWKYCTLEPESESQYRRYFQAEVTRLMASARDTCSHVFVDIVNSSKKRRQMWVDQARRANMRVVGVEFWNPFDVLVSRQATRGDKCVPKSSIAQQVNATSCVWLGHEADHVIMEVWK